MSLSRHSVPAGSLLSLCWPSVNSACYRPGQLRQGAATSASTESVCPEQIRGLGMQRGIYGQEDREGSRDAPEKGEVFGPPGLRPGLLPPHSSTWWD